MVSTIRLYNRKTIIALRMLAALGVALVVADYWSVHPDGSDTPRDVMHKVVLVSIFVMIGCSAWWLTFIPVLRRMTTPLGCFCLAFFIVFVIARPFGSSFRMDGFKRMTIPGNVLVGAIESYIEDRGTAPSALSDLVPAYLERIPSTGVAAYPEFFYKWSDARKNWKLVVPVASGFDKGSLVYYSDPNYPHWPQRLGNWVLTTN